MRAAGQARGRPGVEPHRRRVEPRRGRAASKARLLETRRSDESRAPGANRHRSPGLGSMDHRHRLPRPFHVLGRLIRSCAEPTLSRVRHRKRSPGGAAGEGSACLAAPDAARGSSAWASSFCAAASTSTPMMQEGLPQKAAFIVDEDEARGGRRTPSPEDEVHVLACGTGSKAPDEKSAMARCDQFLRKGLRWCFAVSAHLIAPRGPRESVRVHPFRIKGTIVTCVEDALDLRFVADQRRRLQIANLVGLPQGRRRRQGAIERRCPLGVESAAIELGAPSREGLPREDGIQRPEQLALVAEWHGQAWTPASTASMKSSTSSARPSRTICMAVWPEKPESGSDRYQA